MIVCEQQKLLYLAPPKTGSVSIVNTLIKSPFNGFYYDHKHNHHNTVWEDKFNDWYVFITTRHPYSRIVSFWRFCCYAAIAKNMSGHNYWAKAFRAGLPNLEGFICYPSLQNAFNRHWRASWHLEVIQKPVDKIVYFEKFDEIKQVPGFDSLFLPHDNKGPNCHLQWHEFHTKETLRLTQELWAGDFSKFGYTTDLDACVRGEFFVK